MAPPWQRAPGPLHNASEERGDGLASRARELPLILLLLTSTTLPIMTTLPSFVDLIESLGLDDKEQNVPSPAQQPPARLYAPTTHGHLRSNSWGSTHSHQSSTPSVISPLQSPNTRTSASPSAVGRQPSATSSTSHRFAPYGPPREVSMVSSLPSLRNLTTI